MDGFKREPSRKTPLSLRALYTVARTFSWTSAVRSMLWSASIRISGSTIGTRPDSWTALAYLAKTPSILLERKGGWSTIGGDLKDSSPLGESSTLSVVISSSFLKTIKTSTPSLNWMSTRKRLKTRIDFDTWNHTDFL